jgi:DNA-directed RNA polymerase subunit RPC12/RpoP
MFKKGQSKIMVTQEDLDQRISDHECPECKNGLFFKTDSHTDSDGDLHVRCRHCGASIGVKIGEVAKKTVAEPRAAAKHKAAKR